MHCCCTTVNGKRARYTKKAQEQVYNMTEACRPDHQTTPSKSFLVSNINSNVFWAVIVIVVVVVKTKREDIARFVASWSPSDPVSMYNRYYRGSSLVRVILSYRKHYMVLYYLHDLFVVFQKIYWIIKYVLQTWPRAKDQLKMLQITVHHTQLSFPISEPNTTSFLQRRIHHFIHVKRFLESTTKAFGW